MRVKTWLVLGRVSNLPTVWTNVLAAVVIANTGMLVPFFSVPFDMHTESSLINIGIGNELSGNDWWLLMGTMFTLSLMYVGGMFLNDAFDEQWDRVHGNLRPIVNGEVSSRTVWLLGSVFLVVALVLINYLYLHALASSNLQIKGREFHGLIASLSLVIAIILYNWTHKRFAYTAAFIMGVCRLGVYVVAALVLARLTPSVILAGMALLFYISGLTYLARDEHDSKNKMVRYWPLLLLLMPVFFAGLSGYDSVYFWFFLLIFVTWVYRWVSQLLWDKSSNVGVCIGGLLSAIPLVDGLMLASIQAVIPSIICLLVFLLMPGLHRWVRGT